MRWSLLESPLHALDRDAGLDWARQAEFVYGIPDRAPAAHGLPTVQQVLSAFRQADCHSVLCAPLVAVDSVVCVAQVVG